MFCAKHLHKAPFLIYHTKFFMSTWFLNNISRNYKWEEFLLESNFILEAIIASFSYCTAKRFQEGKNYLGRSLCDYYHPLKWWQLVPIIGYSLQKGKCYFCNSQIKIQSTLLKLFFGTLFIIFLLPYPNHLWPKYIFILEWLLILSLEDFFAQYVSTQLLL